MLTTGKNMMRMVLVIMVFQFLAPAFMPSVVQQSSTPKKTCIHAPHSSIVAPQLLKEQNEKVDENNACVANLAAILDFADHSLNLTATHTGKASHFHNGKWYNLRPAIFKRLHTFLI